MGGFFLVENIGWDQRSSFHNSFNLRLHIMGFCVDDVKIVEVQFVMRNSVERVLVQVNMKMFCAQLFCFFMPSWFLSFVLVCLNSSPTHILTPFFRLIAERLEREKGGVQEESQPLREKVARNVVNCYAALSDFYGEKTESFSLCPSFFKGFLTLVYLFVLFKVSGIGRRRQYILVFYLFTVFALLN